MYQQLTCQQAVSLIEERAPMIVDVRDRDSYQQAHIVNAAYMSAHDLKLYCEQGDKNQPILVYCYHGITSQSVARYLLDQGFHEVYSLTGGFEQWKEHYPYES